MHILAVIMLHRHKFCVYKGKRKLKLPITCENIVLFALYQFLFWFVNIVLENVQKSLQSGFLERVDRVTENTAFSPLKYLKIIPSYPGYNIARSFFSDQRSVTTLFATSFRRRLFAYHHTVKHPHTCIILPWLSIPLVLKCAAQILKIGLQIKI